MSFSSRRLRVQLPCGPPTLIDLDERAANAEPVTTPPCNWFYATEPPCRYLTCLDLPCAAGYGTPCIPSPVEPPPPPRCPAGFITPDVHCRGGTISLPNCPDSRPPECIGLSCVFDSCRDMAITVPCGWPSCQMGTKCFNTETILVEADEGTVLLDPRALPLLRRQLERRLAEIEQAALEKEHVEARLRDLERAERELRERERDDEQQG